MSENPARDERGASARKCGGGARPAAGARRRRGARGGRTVDDELARRRVDGLEDDRARVDDEREAALGVHLGHRRDRDRAAHGADLVEREDDVLAARRGAARGGGRGALARRALELPRDLAPVGRDLEDAHARRAAARVLDQPEAALEHADELAQEGLLALHHLHELLLPVELDVDRLVVRRAHAVERVRRLLVEVRVRALRAKTRAREAQARARWILVGPERRGAPVSRARARAAPAAAAVVAPRRPTRPRRRPTR